VRLTRRASEFAKGALTCAVHHNGARDEDVGKKTAIMAASMFQQRLQRL
jgi:hypothetical protein